MTTFTFATVIVTDTEKAKAQSDLGEGFFTTGLSSSGASPATHWMSSGAFENAELDRICNEVAWKKRVYFGQDVQSLLTAAGLCLITDPSE